MTVEASNLDSVVGDIAEMCDSAKARYEPTFKSVRNGRSTPDSLVEAGQAARAVVAEAEEAINAKLTELVDFYLSATDSQRTHLRGLVAARRTLSLHVFNHSGWCVQHVKTNEDTVWVRRALAALSLEDCGIDYRDTFIALGHIYITAKQLGLDISKELRLVASVSNATSDRLKYWGIETGTKDFFERFESSAFFEASVRPELQKESPRRP